MGLEIAPLGCRPELRYLSLGTKPKPREGHKAITEIFSVIRFSFFATSLPLSLPSRLPKSMHREMHPGVPPFARPTLVLVKLLPWRVGRSSCHLIMNLALSAALVGAVACA